MTRLAELAVQWDIEPAGVHALAHFLTLLAEDERAPTAVREFDRAVDAHVADALSGLAVPELARATRVADLGAGAGIPGLVLAAARPAMQVTEVESTGKKCAFLERAIAVMAVQNAGVACTRVEEWREGLGVCDAVVARALAPLPVVVEYAAPLLTPGGVLVAWKGAPEAGEVADGDAAAAILGLAPARTIALPPFPGADRHTLYVYLKVGSLPNGYPRRPGMARKKPLGTST